jgi:hypothetical protein
VRQSANSCRSFAERIQGGCTTSTTDCSLIKDLGKSLFVHKYCLKIRSSISSSSCRVNFQLSIFEYTICRSRPTVSKGSWSSQTETLPKTRIIFTKLYVGCERNYRSMSLGRPSRRVGRLKEGKAGIVNRLPVTTSSSSIPSGKFGIFLAAPESKLKM